MEEELDNEQIRVFIDSITEQFGFEEVSKVKDTSNDFESVQIKTITKGVFKGRDGYLGIICNFVERRNLKPEFQRFFDNQFPVDNLYEGEKYLLCLANSKIHSFNIVYFNEINSVIDEIDYEFPLTERTISVGIDKDFHILIISTEIAHFLVAGLLDDNQEEEERVILSNKLESSQPFFEFKAPIHFDWKKLLGDKDRQFERICELLLQKESNITSIIPIGKTRASDRGRDFEVIEKVGGLNSNTEIKWLVQCKFSENSISPSSISGWTDRIIEHKYDGFWLMTNNDITPNLFDQFKDVSNNEDYQIKTRFWQRSDFHIKLNVHSELFTKNDIFEIK
jgi:hypothetical protein